MQKTGFTESPNEFTTDIDIASPRGIVEIFAKADAELFSGYKNYPGIRSAETIEKIERIVEDAVSVINFEGNGKVEHQSFLSLQKLREKIASFLF